MKNVQILLEKIADLKKRSLTAMAVAIDFVFHNIQPLKDRVHPACFYQGEDDPTREINRTVSHDEIRIWIRSFITERITNHGSPCFYSTYAPPDEVTSPPLWSIVLHSFFDCNC